MIIIETGVENTLPAVIDNPHAVALAAPRKSAFIAGEVSGEVSRQDLTLPKINIIQSVGLLSEDFKPGSILFRREIVLTPPANDPKDWTRPLDLTVLAARKQFQKVTEYDSDEQAHTVDTIEEVEQAGGWIEWRDNIKPPWRPMLTALVLIRAPDAAAEEAFTLAAPDGSTHELGLWIMAGVSYTRAAKPILTSGLTSLRNKETGRPELYRGQWQLSIRREKLGANLIYVPRLKMVGFHDEEFISFATSLV